MNKGEYGYLGRCKKTLLTISLAILAFLVVLLFGGWLYFKDIKNIVTVAGLLLSLPFARYFSGYLVLLPMKTLPEEEKREIETRVTNPGSDQFLWNLALSSREKMRHFPCLIYSDTRVIAWFDNGGKEKEDKGAEQFLKMILKNGCYQAKVSVYSDKEAFLKAAEAEDFGVAREEDWEKIERTIAIYQM